MVLMLVALMLLVLFAALVLNPFRMMFMHPAVTVVHPPVAVSPHMMFIVVA